MNVFNILIANPSLIEQADYRAAVLDLATRYPYFDLAKYLAVRVGVMPFAEIADTLGYSPYPALLLGEIEKPNIGHNHKALPYVEPYTSVYNSEGLYDLQPENYSTESAVNQDSENEDLCAPFLAEDESLISETLASIFAAQGEKERANLI